VSDEKAPEELQKLADNRALILLVELMGFLHDVGKLSSELYETHYKRWDEEDAKNFPQLNKLFSEKFGELLKNVVSEKILEKVKYCEIKGFQRHHVGGRYPPEYWPKNWIEEIINLADNKDSAEDRGKAISKQGEYIASVFGKERKFFEKGLEEIDLTRKKFWEEIKGDAFMLTKEKEFFKIFEMHEKLKESLRKFFTVVPASTYRASNDITLFDHSYMTGSIAKSLVAKAILNDDIQERFSQQIIRRNASEIFKDKNLPKEEKEIASKTLEKIQPLDHFDDECNLDLLFIHFNSLDFLSQSQNLLDIRGRKELINEIKDGIKNLLEIEFPVGNCVYEDEENLCFLVTPLNEEPFNFLKIKIFGDFNEKTKGLLLPVIRRKQNLKFYGKALVELKRKCEDEKYKIELIEPPKWREKWNDGENKDICVLCNKMPQKDDKEKLCGFCHDVRHNKSQKSQPKNENQGDQLRETLWIDEIADENGKIALIVGKFEPLDKWLSGDFLKYQKIKSLEDIKEVTKKSYLPSIEESVEKLIEEYPKRIKEEKGFVKVLRKNMGEISSNDDWGTVISYRTYMGEIRERVREIDEEKVKKWEENGLSKNEKEKLKRILIEIVETKPPSPSRLFRIWRELKEFSESGFIDDEKHYRMGKRLIFKILDNNPLKNIGFYILRGIEKIGEITVYWNWNRNIRRKN